MVYPGSTVLLHQLLLVLSPSESQLIVPAVSSDEPGTSYGGEVEEISNVIDTALLACLELLESENAKIKESSKMQYVRVEDIQDNNKLVSFYTGFVSFMVFSALFEFLGPVFHNLTYWGSKERTTARNRRRKLDPKNQLFLLLVKLKLNLKLTDLAYRLGLSTSQLLVPSSKRT